MAKKKKAKQGSKAPAVIQVDIVSDVVCPWCWLGARYFLDAAKKSGRKVNLTWRPYMLDPNVPQEGVPYGEYMKAKFGDTPSNRFTAMREALEAAAPDAGINYRFGDIKMRPNTLNAHRLLRWATGQGLGTEAAEALFKAIFDDLKDVGDKAVLADIAAGIGMDKDLVLELLNGDNDLKSVEEEIVYFQNLGVSGVPCFIYGGQFAVQGAQPAETHLAALEKAASLPPE